MRKLLILLFSAAVIAFSISGCGGGSGSDPLGTDSMMFGYKKDLAGTEWSAAMAATPRGTVPLTAKLKNASGNPVIGREVTFGFVSNASGAALSSTKASTGSTGEAMTLYTAGMVDGFDVVRASIPSATLDMNITVGSGGAGGRQISLTGSPTSLAAGKNSILTATVTDSSGNVVSGQTVAFSFISNLSGAPALNVLNLGLTDASGRAVAVYTAGATPPNTEVQDMVKAEIVGTCTTALILTRTSATTAPSTRTLTLSAGISSLTAGQSSILTAKVTDTTGNPVSGQMVTFQFLGGVAAPSGATLSTLSGGTTDASGQALAVYKAGAASSTTSVQDTVQASVAGATGVVIITRTASTAVPPVGYRMALTADVTSMAAGRSAVVTATVTDGSGNSASGQAVTFALFKNNSGATLTTLSGSTDSSGRAVAVYTAGATTPASSFQDVVQASVTGSTGAIVMTRTAAGGGVGTGVRMTVTATPTSVIAGAMSVIVAQVNNADGTAAAGLAVTFGFVTNNSLAPALTTVNATTDASGTAIATYMAGNNSPGLSIQDVVTASVTGSAGAAIITRLPAAGTGNRIHAIRVYDGIVAISPDSLLPSTTYILRVEILRDDEITPVLGEAVTFSTIITIPPSGGGIMMNSSGVVGDPLTAYSDSNGHAYVLYRTPAASPGYAAITAKIVVGDTALVINW